MKDVDVPAPTERVRFRLYQESDLEAVVRMFNDPQARAFYPDMLGPSAAIHWIDWNLESYQTHGFGLWALEDRGTGDFLGDCGLTLQNVEGDRVVEVGYHLLELHRGKGLATEAGEAAVRYAFDVIGTDFVCSIVDPMNHASMAVAGRLHSNRRSFIDAKGSRRWLYWSERKNGHTA